MTLSLLVVVHDLDVLGSGRRPDEADPPPLVDPDAVLAGPVALERLQVIAWRDTKVVQFAKGYPFDPGSKPLARWRDQSRSVTVSRNGLITQLT